MTVARSATVRSAGRFGAAAVAAVVSAAGPMLALNAPVLAAAGVGLLLGWGAFAPARSVRVAALITAALFAILLALALALAYQPNVPLVGAAFAAGMGLAYMGWRIALVDDVSTRARLTAVAVSLIAVFVLIRVLGSVGAEGGHCFLPGLPVGCLP
jgi:hypothetical protein